MSLNLTDDKSTSVQVMAWCRQATSHYLIQCWPSSMLPYGITRPQWVNDISLLIIALTITLWATDLWVKVNLDLLVLFVSGDEWLIQVEGTRLINTSCPFVIHLLLKPTTQQAGLGYNTTGNQYYWVKVPYINIISELKHIMFCTFGIYVFSELVCLNLKGGNIKTNVI